jgi:uncharacterized membrane protein YcaP (DUF421 family)
MSEFIVTDMSSVFRILLVGIGAYISLIGVLRLSGKRTLSKMNAFDLVITVALGSTLATVLLSKDVPLIEGIIAFALLALMQFAVTWSAVRSKRFRKWIKADPRVLFCGGEFDKAALFDERVTRAEVIAAIRGHGYSTISQIDKVTLETDGNMSVIPIRFKNEDD